MTLMKLKLQGCSVAVVPSILYPKFFLILYSKLYLFFFFFLKEVRVFLETISNELERTNYT